MAAPLRLCRWTRADYETAELHEIEGVSRVDDPAEADVVVVPSTRRVGPADVPRARLVITTTSGFDNLDVPALRAQGVRCARLPLARRDAVVETTLAMMLSLTRRLGDFAVSARAGTWDRSKLRRYDARLLGRVGVVGMGVIGTRVAEVLRALGTEVVELRRGDALPADLDVLTLHASLTRENTGMLDTRTLAALRPGCVVINTARGKLMDADAAYAAVVAGHLGGLGVDVFPEEPTRLDRFTHPRVIVTPHAAGWHPGLGEAIADGVRDAVIACQRGEPVPWAI